MIFFLIPAMSNHCYSWVFGFALPLLMSTVIKQEQLLLGGVWSNWNSGILEGVGSPEQVCLRTALQGNALAAARLEASPISHIWMCKT